MFKQIIVNNELTNYYIYDDGRCQNIKSGKFLKGQISNSGYLNYNLTLQYKKQRFYAHRLVAIHFLLENQKEEVNHIDGNKMNNHFSNLQWVSSKENIRHAVDNDLIYSKDIYCFDINKNLACEYKNMTDLIEKTGFSKSIIRQELNKEIKTLSYNHYWSYDKNNLFITENFDNTGKSKIVYQYSLDGKLLNTFSSTSEAAKAIGVNHNSHISECCRGKIKTYKGYKWSYKLLMI